MKLCFLDTETTGLAKGEEKARLVQLAYSSPEAKIDELFKPPVPIKYGAMGIHHITPDMVKDKPVFKETIHFDALQTILKENIMVAHNAPFDIMVLKNEGIEVPYYICTKKLAENLIDDDNLDSFSQQALRYYLGVEIDYDVSIAHNAAGDVELLEGIFAKLYDLLSARIKKDNPEATSKLVITEAVNITIKPALLKTFRFGKHYGKKIADVWAEIYNEQQAGKSKGTNYFEWLLASELKKKEEEERNADMIYTLEYYLNA